MPSLVLAGFFASLLFAADVDVKKPTALVLVDKTAPPIHPDFALNGDRATLADLKGKVVLIEFWAVWCPHCRPFLAHLTRWNDTYHDQGLEVVALTRYYGKHQFKAGKLSLAKSAVDAEAEQAMLAEFAKHHKMNYRIQTIPPDDFRSWKINGIPATILIDRKGVVRLVKISNTSASSREIEAKIKELLDEK